MSETPTQSFNDWLVSSSLYPDGTLLYLWPKNISIRQWHHHDCRPRPTIYRFLSILPRHLPRQLGSDFLFLLKSHRRRNGRDLVLLPHVPLLNFLAIFPAILAVLCRRLDCLTQTRDRSIRLPVHVRPVL